jgi:cytosolic iron-sulfur protein assembly protein CIAO1
LKLPFKDVKKVKWFPGSYCVLSAGYDDTIRIWEKEDDDWICVNVLNGHTSTVWDLDIHPEGKVIATVSDDQTIKLWEIKNSDFKNVVNYSTLSGYHTRTVFSCSFSNEGNYLATVREK